MKKGKANVPPQMRGNYKRQKEMNEMQQQMMNASKPGSDGLPVFNLFVRTKKQKVRFGIIAVRNLNGMVPSELNQITRIGFAETWQLVRAAER